MKKNIIILIPVYNDFTALEMLVAQLEQVLGSSTETVFSLLIVNDGSTNAIKIPVTKFFTIDLLHLHRNLGHQKAIATGLSYLHENKNFDKILVMDGDGEDRPEDVLYLLEKSGDNEGKIILAQRKSRQRSFSFSLFYFFYKLLFRCLTGKKISSGNFMVIPKEKLHQLVFYSEIWNHLSAGIIKSELVFAAIPIKRGARYAGSTKMNFISLILHGLGAIAVFMEQVVSRILIISFVLIFFSGVIILAVIAIKSFTGLAIPGWASTILSLMIIVFLQGFLLSLFTIFLFLSSQSQRKFIPAYHYKEYMSSIETIQHA